MATTNALWVPNNYALLVQFATMTLVNRSLFLVDLVDYTNINHILSVTPSSLQNFMSQVISDNF